MNEPQHPGQINETAANASDRGVEHCPRKPQSTIFEALVVEFSKREKNTNTHCVELHAYGVR